MKNNFRLSEKQVDSLNHLIVDPPDAWREEGWLPPGPAPEGAASPVSTIIYRGWLPYNKAESRWDDRCGEMSEDPTAALVEGWEWRKVAIVPLSAKPTPPEPSGSPERCLDVPDEFKDSMNPFTAWVCNEVFVRKHCGTGWLRAQMAGLECRLNEALRRAEALESALAEAGRDFVRVWNEADGSETPEANRVEVRHVAETAKDKIKAALAPGTTKEAEQ